MHPFSISSLRLPPKNMRRTSTSSNTTSRTITTTSRTIRTSTPSEGAEGVAKGTSLLNNCPNSFSHPNLPVDQPSSSSNNAAARASSAKSFAGSNASRVTLLILIDQDNTRPNIYHNVAGAKIPSRSTSYMVATTTTCASTSSTAAIASSKSFKE